MIIRCLGAALVAASLVGTAVAQKPAAPEGKAPSGDELNLVREVMNARAKYQTSLEQMRLWYVSNGNLEKARWVEEELRQYHRISKQAYNLDLDVPPPTLEARTNIPEANELYRRALTYKDKGWGTDYTDNQRRAEILLRQLLTSYPQSDKIGDAAYQLGDIYESRAYRQYRRAAWYFERAFQWNPTSQLDARLRAARLYDRNLIEREKARKLYQDIITHDTDTKRIQEAQRRLAELGKQR
jgi:TolA-binding protein